MPNRDIVVIGASAGGVEALLSIAKQLPADLPAAVFVVIHIGPLAKSHLPQLLASVGPLPAAHALHGDVIQPGRIYVAPPDNHLMLTARQLQVVRGPQENGYRPAADTLFRSAAHHFGRRVIGVVLSGTQDCGTHGLQMIKARGGIALVQAPEDAAFAGMPTSAIEHVAVDHVVPLAEIADLIVRLVAEPLPEIKTPSAVQDPPLEITPSPYTCPTCHGVLKEAEQSALLTFECHTGHRFSAEALMTEHAAEIEAALWSAVRVLKDAENMARRMAIRTPGPSGLRFDQRAESLRANAAIIEYRVLGVGSAEPAHTAPVADQSEQAGAEADQGKAKAVASSTPALPPATRAWPAGAPPPGQTRRRTGY